MKYIFSICTLLLANLVFGQVEQSKKISKQFDANSSTELYIHNKYGDVHFETWDQARVEIEVTVSAIKSSESKAKEYLDKVEIQMDGLGSNEVSFVTQIEGSIRNGKGEKLAIDYKVNMPRNLMLKVKNSYGSLFLDDFDGSSSLDIAYGNLKVNRLGGVVKLKMSYSNGEIESVSRGTLNFGYSNIVIDNLGDAEIRSNYSNIGLGVSTNIEIQSKYGNLEIDEVDRMSGSSNYGGVRVLKLHESLKLDLNHGGGLKLNWISKDFSLIDIESNYAPVLLKFEKGTAATLDAKFSYGDLKNLGVDLNLSYSDKTNTKREYKGTIGDSGGKGKVFIVSEYGSTRIDYSDIDQ